jgi:hypothetical protein
MCRDARVDGRGRGSRRGIPESAQIQATGAVRVRERVGMKYDEVVKGPVVTPEFRRISMQQVDLAGDLAIVARYAESIDPDEWAGMWFDNDVDPAVIMVAVTRRIELHRARLRTLMARPKQLDVVKHERSESALRELHNEILALRSEYSISSIGTDVVANVVSVGLSVDDASLRDDLQSRFGAQVRVERGIWTAWAT